MVNFVWILRFLVKTMVYGGFQEENKMSKNVKENSLKCRAVGFGFKSSLRGPRVYFLAFGKMTCSHFPNGIFIYL